MTRSPQPIQETGLQGFLTLHRGEERLGFLLGQHDRHMLGPPGAAGFDATEFLAQDSTKKKEHGVERLILGGGGHSAIDRQMGEKRLHLRGAHGFWVLQTVEADELAIPHDVGFLRPEGIVLGAQGGAEPIFQFHAE